MDKLQSLVNEYLQFKSNELLEKIIILLKPFIKYKAKRISDISKTEFKDIEQELFIVLLKRIKSYDKNKSKFITYLFNSMKGDPTGTLQSLTRKKRGGNGERKFLIPISLSEILNRDSDNKEINFENSLHTSINIRDEIEKKDIRELIEKYGFKRAKEILQEEIK